MFLFQNSHLLLCCGRSVQTQVKVAQFIFASIIGLYRYLPPFSFFCFRHPQIVWSANDLASGRSSRHPWRMTKGWGGQNFQKSLDCTDLMCNRNFWPWHNGSLVLRRNKSIQTALKWGPNFDWSPGRKTSYSMKVQPRNYFDERPGKAM